MTVAERDERGGEKMEMLLAENLHLRQLVGELLMKNQRLREAGIDRQSAIEFQERGLRTPTIA